MNEEVWKIPPANLSLSAENVDVWRVSIDQQLVAEHYALLASPEIARAEKFASQDKAREFIVCRGALRKILGVALDENPRTLVFAYEEHGRPYLPELDHYNGVSFSVSHSYDMALIAASRHRQVGIDIEKIREDMDHENLSRRFFSPAECKALKAVDDADRRRAFFAVWTRKEALLKAGGDGIAGGLKKFDVSADPDGPAELLATRWGGRGEPEWSLTNIDTQPEYLACLAVDGRTAIRYWRI